MDRPFDLVSAFTPAGDQPQAIETLVAGVLRGDRSQVLLGVTGSGKTFTMARIVERVQRPTLVIAPNKTLAAQLFAEFKELFPHNAVEYFVSYYDYYQPEAYIPQSDTYIEKDSAINDAIDKMRHSATRSLLTRRDVLIVASVSCIYGLGSPDEYKNMHLFLRVGDEYPMDEVKRRLIYMLYERNDMSFHRGTFRVRGDVIDIFPVHEEERALRVEFFGDTVDKILLIDPLRGVVLDAMAEYTVFPGSHFVTSKDRLQIGHGHHQGRTEGAARRVLPRQPAGGGAAAGAADDVRPGDDPRTRLLQRHRKLQPSSHRQAAGGAAAQPPRLLSRRLPAVHRREPYRHRPAQRHVQRRPLAQGNPGQFRLPPALGPRQPAAALRRVRRADQPGDLRLGHPRRL